MKGELARLSTDISKTDIEFNPAIRPRRNTRILYEEKKLAVECTTGNEFMRKYAEMFPENNDVNRMVTIWKMRSKFVNEANEVAKAKTAAEANDQNGKIVLRQMNPQVQSTQVVENGFRMDELMNQNEIIAGTLGEILDVLTELLALAKKE